MINWLKGAELLDSYRVIPRLFLACYGYLCWDVWIYSSTYPEKAAQIQFVISAIYGAAAVIAGLYMNTGRKWD